MVILNCPSRKGGTPVPVTERDLPRPFPYPRERSLHGLLGLESAGRSSFAEGSCSGLQRHVDLLLNLRFIELVHDVVRRRHKAL